MSSILYYVLLEVQRHVVVISVGLRDLQDHRSSNAPSFSQTRFQLPPVAAFLLFDLFLARSI